MDGSSTSHSLSRGESAAAVTLQGADETAGSPASAASGGSAQSGASAASSD